MISGRNHKILWGSKLYEGVSHMETITKEYLLLFNTITDLTETLERIHRELISVQQQAEELFLRKE